VETRPGRIVETDILELDGSNAVRKDDRVAGEEPLEIRLACGSASRSIAVTMRTPGNDFELAAGFLYGEGVLRERGEFAGITYCLDSTPDTEQRYNVVSVEATASAFPKDIERFERHFTIGSACGVCGRAVLDSLRERGIAPIEDGVRVAPQLLYALPDRMRAAQRVFDSTGGLHAAALFTASGETIAVREDVGRHNAVDKLVGWGLLESRLPFTGTIALVSGRAGYEIVQKCAVARIPILCSISAPSSLAVRLAREFGVTLVGFLRGDRANVYSRPERVALS
jgi:FdhD protein